MARDMCSLSLCGVFSGVVKSRLQFIVSSVGFLPCRCGLVLPQAAPKC